MDIYEKFNDLFDEFRVFRSLVLIMAAATTEIANSCDNKNMEILIDGYDLISEKSNQLWTSFDDLELCLNKCFVQNQNF